MNETPLVTFDYKAAARGIVFHLVDEGMARTVNPASLGRMLDRLALRGETYACPEHTWERMENGTRLRWLQNQTRTKVAVDAAGQAFFTELR